MAEKNLPKEYADKSKRIQQASEKYQAGLGALKKRRRELAERVIKRIEKNKIDEIKESIR